MIGFDPIGWDALAAALERWTGHLWIIAPAMLLSFAAFALRYRTALRSHRRFDDRGAGPWRDGKVRVPGRLAVVEAEHLQGFIVFAQYVRRMHEEEPERVKIDAELRVLLDDGRALRIPAGASVKFEVSRETAGVAGYKTLRQFREGSSKFNCMGFGAMNGAPLWVIVPASFDARASAPLIELARPDEVEVHFARVDGAETHIASAYALPWLSAITGGALAFAAEWTPVFTALEALFAGLAALAARSALRDHRALEAIEAQRAR